MTRRLCVCHVWLDGRGREGDGQRHCCIRPEWDAAGQPLNAAAFDVDQRKRDRPEGLDHNPVANWVQLRLPLPGSADLIARRMLEIARAVDDARRDERRQRRSA